MKGKERGGKNGVVRKYNAESLLRGRRENDDDERTHTQKICALRSLQGGFFLATIFDLHTQNHPQVLSLVVLLLIYT